MTFDIQKETREAINAGERALCDLKSAKSILNSARNWGVMDMLGGGMITGFVKRSKVRDSQGYLRNAKRNLDIFAKELSDVSIYFPSMDIEIDDFLGFADLFWDNIFSDWMMQERINETREKVDETIMKVERILYDLSANC